MNDSTDTTKETYSEYFQEYIEKFEQNGPRTEDIQDVFELYKESGAHVVELGCSCGRDAAEIIQYTNRYIGIDYVPEFIEYAKESLPNTTFLTEDIETYTPPAHTDIIFAFASLLHLSKEKLAEVLVKAHTSLSDKGLMRISLKQADEYKEKVETDKFGQRTFYYYSEKDIREITSQFKVIFIHTKAHAGKNWLEILLQK